MSSDTTMIQAQGLAKSYALFTRPHHRLLQMLFRKRQFFASFDALKGVNFSIKRGESIGIIGRNGSGKSTLLQLVCGTLAPTRGSVTTQGRIAALLELGAGFNPEFTGEENITLAATLQGMTRAELKRKHAGIIAFAGIGEHIKQPVKTYSSGMYVRLAFAVAIASEPDILIVDEALAVGDERFQRKCFSRMRELQARGTTILFVSHAPNTILELCNRAFLMDAGELLMQGAPKDVIGHYHRLLFAPKEKQAAIRKEILTAPNAPQKAITASKNMIPESRQVLGRGGAEILAPCVVDHRGKKINILTPHKKYAVRFAVKFTRAFEEVRFNFRITNTSGVLVAGHNTANEDKRFARVKAGSRYEVSFPFTCALMPETYFVTVACSAVIEGERMPVTRINDALMFKVHRLAEASDIGIVDLSASVKVHSRT